MKGKRLPLQFGSENSAAWPAEPWPVATGGYDFDPNQEYSVLMDDGEVGHCRVERDFTDQLFVVPDFEINFNEEDVKFYGVWQVHGDKALLSSVLLVPRRSPTQPWV